MAGDALDIARAVAREAADLLRDASGRAARTWSKSTPRDLVTEWDTRTEALIRERLHALTPGIPLLGEEGGQSSGSSGSSAGSGTPQQHGVATPDTGLAADESAPPYRAHDGYRWLVDPIDGTVNFAHGLPIFSVVIALEHNGQPVAGVVHAPVLDWEFYGHVGGGAYCNGERLQVSRIETLERALLTTGFPYDRATNPDNNLDAWAHFQRRAGACRRLGSASLDLCLVARGSFDGYWERRLNPWDVSAGALLVREAGGQVTSSSGHAFSSAAGDVVASNGMIHRQMLDELAVIASVSGLAHS